MNPEDMQALAQAVAQAVVAALKSTPAEEPSAPPAAPPAAPAPDKMGDTGEDPMAPPAMAPDMDKDKMAKGYVTKQQYAALERTLADNTRELEVIKAEKREAVRVAAYSQLRAEGYQFNEAKELERTKNYSDEQFTAHEVMIRENYSKHSGGRLFVPAAQPLALDDERTSREAVRIATERYSKDKKKSHREHIADVRKEMGLPV